LNEYRQRALNRVNNTSGNAGSTTSTYRQRALNRQQPKVEEPKVEIAEVEEPQHNFTPEDANLMKNMVNSRIAMSNAINYPKIVEEKKAEKAEQERLANLSAGEKFVEGWEKLEQTPVLKGINTVGAVASSVLGGIVSGTEDLLKSGASTYLNAKSRMAKKDIENKEKALQESINKAIGKGNYTEEQKQELQRAGNAWLNQNTSEELQDIYNSEELSKELQKKNYTREALQPIIQEDVNKSYLPQKGSELLQSVGNIIPSLYTGAKVTGALNTGSQLVSTLPFLAQSSQAGTTRALEEGATLEQAEKYGLASGAAETAVELLSGGIGGAISNKIATKLGNKFLSKATMDKITNNVIGKYAVKLVDLGLDMTTEGLEEVASDIIDPYLQRATYNELAELSTNESRLQSFIDGALSTFILRAGLKAGTINKNDSGIQKLPTEQQKASETAQPEKNAARELPTMASQQAMLPTNRVEGQTAQTGNMGQMAENEGNLPKNEGKKQIKEAEITDEVLNAYDGEIFKLMSAEIDGEVVGTIEYSEYNGKPHIQMINVNQDYRRKGIAKKMLQDLQSRYPEIEINWGYTTEDGTKLYESVTEKVENPNFDSKLFNKAEKLKKQIKELEEQKEKNFELMKEFYPKYKDNTITQEEQEKYTDVQHAYMSLEDDIRDANNDLYDLTNGIDEDKLRKYHVFIKNDAADTQYAQAEQKGYISPSQDIQKATEFINKATVEDIDTLNKMVEEAEKYPDRIDLQYFAEKARARLEKLSREQIENMLEEGIDTNKISYNNSIYRNLRRVLGENGYQYAKENILDKLDAAKLDNVNMKIEIANELKSYVVDELGIKKGSKESELVQKYGEKEITLDELKETTPNWQNVVKADKWFRSKYDQLIDMINESRTEIYPYIEEKIEVTELELKVVKQQIKDIEENGTPNYKKDAEIRTQIENIQKRIDAKDEKLKTIKNKDTLAYKNNLRIKNEAVERLNDLNDLLDIRAENKLGKLEAKADKLQKILDSEELWRGKRIPKRKDYYRHFQEMTEGFEALGNILATPSEISNQLSGISENTKPNSKWLGLAQRRLTNKTKYDAVGGFLNYLDSASYAINIDPEIKRIRDFTEEIRNASGDNTTANRLIEYLTDYANDLAGKTNPMDRYLQKIIPGGRKTMKAISWVTNRIKSNAVLGNFNSAAAQILNLPQGLADIKYPKNIAAGIMNTVAEPFVKSNRYKDSQFINERFKSDVYSQFDEKLINQPKKMAVWMLGALDELGTKTIWNGEYSKAVDMGIKDPVRYADYRTRDLVAGRGIGELSLNQRSKTIGLLAPFTVEVSNYWGVVKDFISAKDFGGLILLQVFGHLFNEGLEELGISAGVFDLIDALIDAWNTEGGIDKKVGRVAGEYLSNTMFGQQLASLYPENGADLGVYKLPTRSELFGDADPTRMGTGSVLSKAITNPITSVVMPWGGTQLNKTTQGLSTFAKGGSYTKDAEGKDKLKYPVEQTPSNAIKSALFGKWATPGAKDYIDRGFKPLSANQTEAYEKAMKAGISSDDFFKVYDATRGIEGDKDKNGKTIENSKSKKLKEAIDKATTKLTSKQRKILYDAFNVSKTVQGGSGLPTQSELRANLPKVEIKIEK
jgi:ribosomal protein S18 acetylase RimI-like enzyme